ncbi:phospholipase A2 inhibitor beta-like [Aphidius gifuensis]|uniref:phospholipase A2 inhibitor beta-like n=1 Tax=Aphidius gifuensis TaxID=684658 RepID=UPI001CDD21D4|nr:phospholipase A2 inhibitor beta-like [Aphidius gifuensis]
MVIKNLLMIPASSVAGIFMLIVACSLVIPGSTEKNSKIISTSAQSILPKLTNDNGAVDLSNVAESQIDLKAHTTVSSISDKYFSDLKGHLSVPLELELENYNNDLETHLIHEQNDKNDLVTGLSLRIMELDSKLKQQKENYKTLLDTKTLRDNKLSQRNDTCKQISCQDKKQEQKTVIVDDSRKRFDDIASTSNSQFSNRYFCNKKISYYNWTICAFFSENLHSYEINMKHINLPVLPKNIFTGFDNLRELYLSHNRLYRLESGTFNNLSKLTSLYIKNNNITELPSDIFNGLKQLRFLILSSNKLNSLEPGTFNNLSKLVFLHIENNNLTALSSNVFNGLDKLEDLNLSWNKLNSLEPGTFNNLSNLEYLLINNNHLTSLPEGIFTGLENLRGLRLSDNRISYLGSDHFNNLPALTILDVRGNNLTTDSINILKNIYNNNNNIRNFYLWLYHL